MGSLWYDPVTTPFEDEWERPAQPPVTRRVTRMAGAITTLVRMIALGTLAPRVRNPR